MQKRGVLFIWIPAMLFIVALCFFLPGLLRGAERDNTDQKRRSEPADALVYDGFYADIYYTAADRDYVETVAQCLDFYAPLIYADFALDDRPSVSVVLYPSAQAMAKTLAVDAASPPMGLYSGGVIHVLSPSAWIVRGTESHVKERFVKEGPLLHELAHLATDIKTGGNYSVWLTEGVALYYENKYAAFEWRADLKEESAALSIGDLENNFRGLDEAKAYRRSFDIVNDYVAANSEQALQAALAGLKDR
jgi:hypothetical protein